MDHGTPEPTTAGTGPTYDGDPSAARDEPALRAPIPRTIDRYVVLEQLGHGGMGVVYEAYDPRLDRRVALKLIRADGRRDRLRARLLCEAKALARISHPNVLPVYDSGLVADQAFVAMALVRGRTLRRWLEDEAPSWTRIVETLVALGHGLTVVHQAGLVHRDIKPENILLDQSGRPLLIDFGLARMLDEQRLEQAESEPIDVAADGGRLTQRGAMIGSPPYMAPEQVQGHEVGPAADQFGYCVTAWEALFGRRPFEVDDIELRSAAIEAGPPDSPHAAAAPRPAARRLARMLARGLEHDPRRRWPTISCLVEALASELRRARARRRRSHGIMTVGSAALLAAGLGWSIADRAEDPMASCVGAALGLEDAWNPEVRAGIAAAFARGPAWVGPLRAKADARLDRFAQGWRSAHEDSCIRHRRGSLTDLAHDRRMQCLDRRQAELVAVADVLADLPANELTDVPDVLAVLGSIAECSDDQALAEVADRIVAPRVELAPSVMDIDHQLVRITALHAAGRFADARDAIEALSEAPGLAHEPTAARVDYVRGSVLDPLGQPEEALESLSRALWSAEAVGDTILATQAARHRLEVMVILGREDDVERWIPHARALARRAHDPLQTVYLELVLAELAGALGRTRESRDRLIETIDLLRSSDIDPLTRARLTATAHGFLSFASMRLGREEEATAHAEHSVEQTEKVYGGFHPMLGLSCYHAGVVALSTGRNDRAVEVLRRAIDILDAVTSPVHPNTLATKQAYSRALRSVGRLSEARALGERTQAEIFEHIGPETPQAQVSHLGLGITLMELGDLDAARIELEASLALRRASLESPDDRLLPSLHHLADLELAAGRLDRAESLYREGEAIFVAGEQRYPLDRADLLAGRGGVALAPGEHEDARSLLEEALSIRDATEEHYPRDRATLLMRLAQVRWALAGVESGAREQARETARRGLEALADVGVAGQRQREALDRWLAAH